MAEWEEEPEITDTIDDPESDIESEPDEDTYLSDDADSLTHGDEMLEKTDNLVESDEESETDDEDDYVEKLSKEFINDHVETFHPEIHTHNYEEVRNLTNIVRDRHTGLISDPLHRTLPFLTKYEKTRVLGIRAKHINDGGDIYVDVKSNIVDGYTIAEMELMDKKIPFIIKRPIPNGSCEYWKLSDLELL